MECITSIEEQAHSDTSYGAKKSVLETLRKIGKIICLGPSTLGSEVIKQMAYDTTLTDATISILESMTVDERLHLAGSRDEKREFYTKVVELATEAEGHCMFEDLARVLELLDGKGEDEDDDDEDEESGEDEDED